MRALGRRQRANAAASAVDPAIQLARDDDLAPEVQEELRSQRELSCGPRVDAAVSISVARALAILPIDIAHPYVLKPPAQNQSEAASAWYVAVCQALSWNCRALSAREALRRVARREVTRTGFHRLLANRRPHSPARLEELLSERTRRIFRRSEGARPPRTWTCNLELGFQQ